MDLTGRTALITGASRGIGRAIALRFAEAGANVALLARSVDALAETARMAERHGVSTLAVPCDIKEPAQIDAAFAQALETFTDLDILVNNAGSAGCVGPFLELSDKDWQHVIDLDLRALIHFVRLFGRHAIPRGSGCVLNISTVAADRGVPMLSHYAALKAAMNSLTRSLAAEWAASGIRVNAIAPGWVATNLTDTFHSDPAVSASLMTAVPTGRWAMPDDIVEGALYLVSDAASMVTGSILTVDGGMTACNGGPALIEMLALGRIEIP
ncbi:SDR family NAD(P)-dependent oxidoreductase [Spirillospora sp. NPDC048911]|uniref:SDR family NAD(P)-dependent oxidoreductase n=1 Tax=Spirillospora sp. NPDC048911 TaxID=3364527 RepID=UPI003722950D